MFTIITENEYMSSFMIHFNDSWFIHANHMVQFIQIDHREGVYIYALLKCPYKRQ